MKSEINVLLEKHNLGKLSNTLEKYLSPCVAFDLVPQASSIPIGASKLGGEPDLPNDFIMPENKGRPLDFLLQLNLGEVSKFDKIGLLPTEGLLSFFYDFENQPWGFDPNDLQGYKVFYSTEINNLTRAKLANSEYRVEEFGLTFQSGITLPFVSSLDYSSISKEADLDKDDFEKYWDFHNDFSDKYSLFSNPQSRAHRILGHSQNVQGDMQTEAQLVMNGYYCGRPFKDKDPKREKIKECSADWILLLQLDSDDKSDFMWGDDGMLYFWIRKQDLAQCNFDKVWMTLQCS